MSHVISSDRTCAILSDSSKSSDSDSDLENSTYSSCGIMSNVVVRNNDIVVDDVKRIGDAVETNSGFNRTKQMRGMKRRFFFAGSQIQMDGNGDGGEVRKVEEVGGGKKRKAGDGEKKEKKEKKGASKKQKK